MSARPIRTRFAPSPTGFLHIGGARTALFNYYFAKHVGGEFHLRIEDTDKARSTPEATQAILDGLEWLGLSYDGEIVYQSQNADAHAAAAQTLLDKGLAYRCPLDGAALETERDLCRAAGTAFRSPYRDKTSPAGAIRFRVPEGQTKIHDYVQGNITWENENFDDLVLLREDGTPTYMLAVVVDDHNMGITHVVRGDDHLINAGRQQQLYAALGWDIPEWAHVPLIHGPDGKKLSKRHGALGVEAYRDMGYLPSGLRNYLVKLGWSHGDAELFFSDAEIAKVFTLDGINSSPARLDFDKMDHINGQHMARAEDATILELSLPFLNAVNGGPLTDTVKARISDAMSDLKTRAKTLKDIPDQAAYLMLQRPLTIAGKAAKPLRKDGVMPLLDALTFELKSVKSAAWTAENIQAVFDSFMSKHEIGFGKIGQPVRAALTGGAPSPDLSAVLAYLGQEEVIGRLSDALQMTFDE
ncbi:glutamate--tRNA ligase [Litorimonas sp. RW-G-Af-16]|uniref:glutamate--tRNA ligase n=1 Tax=Litorimonas sp. RW-G-Af-16 TaxID=3241168 RepID=UPI00390CCCCE